MGDVGRGRKGGSGPDVGVELTASVTEGRRCSFLGHKSGTTIKRQLAGRSKIKSFHLAGLLLDPSGQHPAVPLEELEQGSKMWCGTRPLSLATQFSLLATYSRFLGAVGTDGSKAREEKRVFLFPVLFLFQTTAQTLAISDWSKGHEKKFKARWRGIVPKSQQ